MYLLYLKNSLRKSPYPSYFFFSFCDLINFFALSPFFFICANFIRLGPNIT